MNVILFANDTWYIRTFRLPLIERLSCGGAEVTVISGDTEYMQEIEAAGANFFHIVYAPRSFGIGDTISSVFAFARIIWRIQPSFLLTFNPKSNVVASLANVMFGARQIANISGFGTIGNLAKNPTQGILSRAIYGRIGYWMVKSPFACLVQNAEDFKLVQDMRGSHRQTMRVMGSGVDLAVFNSAPRDWEIRRTLFAGRFLIDKGIKSFIDIARDLQSSTAPFLVAGRPVNGPGGLSETDVLASIQGTPISYLGEVKNMPTRLAQTDIFVLPSVYGEGIPRTLIEAAASGCVLVAYDIDGVREIVQHEVNGLLVPRGDAVALRTAIATLLEAPSAQMIAMSQASRQLAEKSFSEEDILDLYADLMGIAAPISKGPAC